MQTKQLKIMKIQVIAQFHQLENNETYKKVTGKLGRKLIIKTKNTLKKKLSSVLKDFIVCIYSTFSVSDGMIILQSLLEQNKRKEIW